MSVTVYLDSNYAGESQTFGVGQYNRQDLLDESHGEFDNNITSLKVDRNTIVLLSDSSHPTGSGNKRVLIGPQNISDLSALGFNDRISSMKVNRFRESDWGANAIASIFSNYNYTGKHKNLRGGEYDAARIASREDNRGGIPDGDIRSLTVGANTVLILYDGPNFDTNMNSVYVEGPASISDLSKYSMDGKLSSIKVYSIDSPPVIPEDPNRMAPKYPGTHGIPPVDHHAALRDPAHEAAVKAIIDGRNSDSSATKKNGESGVVASAKIYTPWSEEYGAMGIKNGLFILLFIVIILTAFATGLVMRFTHISVHDDTRTNVVITDE